VYTWCHHDSGKEIGIFFIVCWILAENFETNIKAVHNLKTKSLGIILTPWAMFALISAFLLFLVSEVDVFIFDIFGVFFWQILPQLKTSFQKSKCAHRPCTGQHPCAKFDVFRPSQF